MSYRVPVVGDHVIFDHPHYREGVVVATATDRDNQENFAKVKYTTFGFTRYAWVWAFDLKYLNQGSAIKVSQ